MGRGKKNEKAPEEKLSMRDRIVKYRSSLHGDHARVFDEVFYPAIGVENTGGIRKALNKTSGNPHSAFTTAKAAVDKLPKPPVEETEEDE